MSKSAAQLLYGPVLVIVSTDQSHPPHDRDAVHTLQTEVEQAGHHDHQVKDVPPVAEILLAQCRQLEDRLEQEERGEHLQHHIFRVSLGYSLLRSTARTQ